MLNGFLAFTTGDFGTVKGVELTVRERRPDALPRELVAPDRGESAVQRRAEVRGAGVSVESFIAGAWLSGGAYAIPAKPGLFVYDWDFTANSVRQFKLMSVAGSVGGAVGLVLLWSSVPADTSGRAALLAGGVASFAFAAAIECPVLRRTGLSGDPLAELSKIDVSVLLRSLAVGIVAGVIAWYLLAP